MKNVASLILVLLALTCRGENTDIVTGKPIPDDWQRHILRIDNVDYLRQQYPEFAAVPTRESILHDALKRNLGPDPQQWPDTVKLARQHELEKTANPDRLKWLRENEPKEADLLEQDIADPQHFWMRVFNRESQPFAPRLIRVNYLDTYFREVFPWLCRWLLDDVDGNVLQPKAVEPPKQPPILQSIKPGMPPEEMARIAQSKAFIDAVQSYQAEMLAYQRTMSEAQSGGINAYKNTTERWLAFNEAVYNRFLEYLEAKAYTMANIFMDGYSTQSVGAQSKDEADSMRREAEQTRREMSAQMSSAMQMESRKFREAFLASLQFRFGQHTTQVGSTIRTLLYQLDLQQPLLPDEKDQADPEEYHLGRNSISVKGYTGLETITGPNHNTERNTIEVEIESNLSQELPFVEGNQFQVLAKSPNYVVVTSKDPYNEEGVVLNLLLRGIPGGYSHSVHAVFAAGGRGSGIDGSTVNIALDKAFKESFLAAAGSLYANLQPWPEDPDAEPLTTVGISVSADPKETYPDGQSNVTIRVETKKYPAEKNAAPVPLANVSLTLDIPEIYGIKPGSLSTKSVTTDASGQAEFNYTVPDMDALRDTLIRSVAVRVRSDEWGLEDSAYIHFSTDKATVFVEPAAGGIASDHGLLPADPRYPATIRVRLEDNNVRSKANTEVKFRITSKNPVGELFTGQGATGTELLVRSDQQGWAEVFYRCKPGIDTTKVHQEIVAIESPGLLEPKEAKLSVGMDLAIAQVRNLFQGKGMVNAGEQIPIEITVTDPENPDLKDLREVLYYWGSGGLNGDEPLSIRLRMEPLGNMPGYLITRMAAAEYPASAFEDRMDLRPADGKPGNILWMRQGSLHDYQGLPKLNARYEGKNYFIVTVELVDGSGNLVVEANHANNIGYLSIPTGIPADAFTIFFLENPLGPNTPEAAFFRTVLNLMGYGAVLSLADAANAINTGDMEALASVVVGEFTGKITESLEKADSSIADWANLYGQMTIAEQVTSTFVETKTPIGDLQKQFISAAFRKSAAVGRKLVIVTGDGSQHILRKDNNKIIEATEGTLSGEPGDTICILKNGPVTVLLVPEDFQFLVKNARDVRESRL